MILLDSEVLLLDLRYQRDPRFSVNQQVLHQLRAAASPGGITLQALLEIIGVLSFNLAAASVPPLLSLIPIQYGLLVVPDPDQPSYHVIASAPRQEQADRLVKEYAAVVRQIAGDARAPVGERSE